MSRMRTNKLLRTGGGGTTQYRSLRPALITFTAQKPTLPVSVTTTVSSAQAITQLQQFDEIYENTSLLE